MEEKHSPDGELTMQLKRITEQLGFLEKKIDQLLEARREQKPFGQKSFGQKPYGSNRYGGSRPAGRDQGQGFNRNYSSNHGRTRTAFYEGGSGSSDRKHQGAPSHQGHFKKKFQPHRPHRPS